MWKKIVAVVAVVLVALQFVRPARNISPGPAGKDDFAVAHAAPADVKQMLAVACYDCHSNNTRYPWYAAVQPVGLWLDKHVRDGKKQLNFSEFAQYSAKDQRVSVEGMIDQITDGTMPLKSYTLIHTDAKFTAAQKTRLTDWLQAERDKMD